MSPRVRAAARAAIQITGLILGILALGWCIRQALAPDNRAQLTRLSEASASSVGALIALTVGTLLLNGLTFWATLRPVQRLRPMDVLAVNALATFLGYLPFKLGAVVRAAIHHKRDRVPIPLIGAWFAAVILLMLSTLGPLAAASIWRGRVDAAWFAAGLIGIGACSTLLVLAARAFRGERGLKRLEGPLAILGPARARRLLHSRSWSLLHRGFDIVASAPTVAAVALIRLLDAAAQAGRFVVAASILGQTLTAEQAVLVAAVYFLIGVASPTGMLGFREAGAAGLAGLLAFTTSEEFAAVALLVGAADAAVNLVGAGAGLAWLRPDRWVRRPAISSAAAPGT